MQIDIVQFKAIHLEQMDMREQERKQNIDGDMLIEISDVSETVLMDGVPLCCYGITSEGGLWQVPSNNISTISGKYARGTIKTIKRLMKGYDNVHTICISDDFHKRWMRFLGFSPKGEVFMLDGKECLYYEVV